MKEAGRRVLELNGFGYLTHDDSMYSQWSGESYRRLIDISVRSSLGLNNKRVHEKVKTLV